MVKLVSIFSDFQPIDVLVIGDIVMDVYTTGKVKRISPEAPVTILNVDEEKSLPGGAANVVLNLISLGARVRVIGRLGQDLAGFKLKEALAEEGVDVRGLIFQNDFRTPVKNRLIAGAQQILRVDTESIVSLPISLEDQLIKDLSLLLEGIRIIAVSDYGKGFLSRRLFSALVAEAKKKEILNTCMQV
jgi:D-beta-D-heptose 7-phosphate kinase/D-beta-D-heptose 1-phosphate adenosyltransferase